MPDKISKQYYAILEHYFDAGKAGRPFEFSFTDKELKQYVYPKPGAIVRFGELCREAYMAGKEVAADR